MWITKAMKKREEGKRKCSNRGQVRESRKGGLKKSGKIMERESS